MTAGVPGSAAGETSFIADLQMYRFFCSQRGKMTVCLLGMVFLLGGCSRDPLESARAQKVVNADHWRLVEHKRDHDLQDAFLSIKAKTSVTTSEGTTTPQLGLDCSSDPNALVALGGRNLIGTGDVKITFDDGEPFSQKWERDSSHRSLAVPESVRDGFIFRLTNAKKFAIEISPQGGTPQTAEFAVLNLRELMNREASCGPWLAEAKNPGAQAMLQNGEWMTHRLKIGEEDEVIFSLEAKNTIHVLGNDAPGTLKITCGVGSLIDIDAPPPQNMNVKVAYDAAAPVQEKWEYSADLLGPASLDARKQLLSRLLDAKTFSFEYTPKGASPQTLTFDLAGLKDLVNREKSCESWLHAAF